MKTRIISIVLMLAFVFPLFALPSAAQIPLSSPLYEQMDTLYRLHGLTLPSSTRPWSVGEARRIFSRIPEHTPYESLALAVSAFLMPMDSENLFTFNTPFVITAEAYTHANSEDFKTPYDWIRSVDGRLPLLRFFVNAAFTENAYFSTAIDVGSAHATINGDEGEEKNWGTIFADSGNRHYSKAANFSDPLVTNMFYPNDSFPISDWPQISQLSFGGDFWATTIGRSAVKWGHGNSGDLVVGSHIANHNHLSLSLFGNTSKFTFLTLFLPDSQFNPDGPRRFFLGHRLEFSPAKWARISLSENAMFKGDSLYPEYLDPSFFMHNLYNRRHLNAIASVEADFSLYKGLSLHGQFVMDQYQLPSEGDSEANAMGFLTQVAYSWPGQSGFWTLSAEAAYTDPVLYRRDIVDFLVVRSLQNNSWFYLMDYLGYRWGSDSQVYQGKLDFFIPNQLTVNAAITIHRQGQISFDNYHHIDESGTAIDNEGYPNVWGPSPSGPEIRDSLILSLSAEWQSPIKGLSVHGELDWIGRRLYTKATQKSSNHAADIQLTLGVSKDFL